WHRGLCAVCRNDPLAAAPAPRWGDAGMGAKMGTMRIRRDVMAFLAAAIVAALMPLVGTAREQATNAAGDFPGWPTRYEGRALTELPLTEREAAFVRGFPGKVGRFSDGRREIII